MKIAMKIAEILVDSCYNCPNFDDDVALGMKGLCLKTRKFTNDINPVWDIPKWCPLKDAAPKTRSAKRSAETGS